MADIFHYFPIKASAARVFQAVSTPAGLDSWWTKRSTGRPKENAEYQLWFSPEYDWRARVSKFVPGREFEIEITKADKDWQGTRVGFVLQEQEGTTQVHFHHTGWPSSNEHHRVSCYCWAMYLRVLKRNIEFGEVVQYEDRLDV